MIQSSFTSIGGRKCEKGKETSYICGSWLGCYALPDLQLWLWTHSLWHCFNKLLHHVSRLISVQCCIHFSPSSLTVGESDHCEEPSSHPRVWMGWRSSLCGGRSMCKNEVFMLKHFHSMSLMKPSIVILEYASDIREEKNPLMEQPGHSYSGRPLTSLGTSCWTLTWPTASTPDQSCPYRPEQSALSTMGASLYKQDLRPQSPALQFPFHAELSGNALAFSTQF